LDTVREVFSRLKGVQVSKSAEAAMLAVVGIMELMEIKEKKNEI